MGSAPYVMKHWICRRRVSAKSVGVRSVGVITVGGAPVAIAAITVAGMKKSEWSMRDVCFLGTPNQQPHLAGAKGKGVGAVLRSR